jgi:predicted peptidase
MHRKSKTISEISQLLAVVFKTTTAMNTIKIFLICMSSICLPLAAIYAQTDPILKIAKDHPIQYYVSFPKAWTAKSKFAVVILFEAAGKEYKKNIERFIAARGEAPFILVQPIHTNNGNQGRGDATLFPYTKETWAYIDKVGDCQFNSDGINAIYNEIHGEYNTQDRWYVTGFEAGVHMLWWMVFNRPDLVKVAVPVEGNYRSRCVDESKIDHGPKSSIIIKAFFGDKDELSKPGAVFYDQWIQAKDVAKKNGFSNISEQVVAGKGHETMEKEVLDFFAHSL